MKIERLGIIVNTEKYRECVDFYTTLLGAQIMVELDNDHSNLTCLEFGDCYLMIEKEGRAVPEGKTIRECPSKIRLNVSDIFDAEKKLKSMGIEAKVESHPWGSSINTFDPDGNRIGIRDEAGFLKHVSDHKTQQTGCRQRRDRASVDN